MSEQTKAIVRRYIEEVINHNQASVIEELFDTGYINHTPMGDMRGPEGMTAFIARTRAMLPDVRATVEDMFTEGDRVAVRLTLHGTYAGEVMGIAYDGKRVTLPEIQVYRIANGKIVERWYIADRLGLWQQLGAIPSSPPTR
jgi:steroid delta-isomerase-like uncharacterized protein